MKNLRINSGKGEFSLDGVNFRPVDEVNKDDLLTLLEIALDPNQEMEMDEYVAETVVHPAHKIIYGNLYDKFTEVISSKEQFVDDVNELYKEAYDKYKMPDVVVEEE